MNQDWTTEQDKEFDEKFPILKDEEGYRRDKFVRIYIHNREALLLERVVGEVQEILGDGMITILQNHKHDRVAADIGEEFLPLFRSLQDLLASKKV